MASDLFSDWTRLRLIPLMERQANERATIEKGRPQWEAMHDLHQRAMAVLDELRDQGLLRYSTGTSYLSVTLTRHGSMKDIAPVLEVFEEGAELVRDETTESSRDFSYRLGAEQRSIYVYFHESRKCRRVIVSTETETVERHTYKTICDDEPLEEEAA